MIKKISIKAGAVQATAELNDTRTARAIWEALPIKVKVNLWGEEIYFPVPVKLGLEKGQDLVNVGDLGYWPQGHAFCLFFGPTPVSGQGEIRPASAVTAFGRVTSDATLLKKVAPGAEITIERI